MMSYGSKCKTCKNYLHYEQVYGMRTKHEVEKGKYVYNTYCPTCNEYGTEPAPNDRKTIK